MTNEAKPLTEEELILLKADLKHIGWKVVRRVPEGTGISLTRIAATIDDRDRQIQELQAQLAAAVEWEKVLPAVAVLREGLESIASYGCCNEIDGFCRSIETSVEEYCHPCQAQDVLNKLEKGGE